VLSAGASFSAVTVTIVAILCTGVFLPSLIYATKNIAVFDTVCLTSALLVTAVWFLLRDALLAVVLVSLIDLLALAFLPTFRKAYTEPHSETTATYVQSGIADGLALLAFSVFNVTTSPYLFTLVVTNFACAEVISFDGRKWPKQK